MIRKVADFSDRGYAPIDNSPIAGRSDPSAHTRQMAGDRDVRYTSDQVPERNRTMRHAVTGIHAVGTVVAQYEDVPGGYLRLRQVREQTRGRVFLDIGLLDRHPVDDSVAGFDRNAIAFHCDD